MLWVSRTMPVPSEVVWDLLVDTTAWPSWGPTVAEARLSEPGTSIVHGSRGRVRPVVGPWVPFEVTELVPGVRWSWRVAGIPVTTHEVEAVGAGCRVRFGVPVWAPAYLAVCALALRRIERLALATPPGH
jgi:uncharacterized protein YndB with AHSA1/START domain